MNRLEQTWTDLNTETQARTQTPERTITTQKTIKYQNAEAIGFLRFACVWKWSTWNCSGLRNLLDISTVSTICLFPDVFSLFCPFLSWRRALFGAVPGQSGAAFGISSALCVWNSELSYVHSCRTCRLGHWPKSQIVAGQILPEDQKD